MAGPGGMHGMPGMRAPYGVPPQQIAQQVMHSQMLAGGGTGPMPGMPQHQATGTSAPYGAQHQAAAAAAAAYGRQQHMAGMAHPAMMGQAANRPGAPPVDPRHPQYQQMLVAQQQQYQASMNGATSAQPGTAATPTQPNMLGSAMPSSYAHIGQYPGAQPISGHPSNNHAIYASAQQRTRANPNAAPGTPASARGPKAGPAGAAGTPAGMGTAAVPPHVLGVPPPPLEEDPLSSVDVLDVVNSRQLAIHRFSKNHDLLASVFDPWSVSLIMDGSKRKRETVDGLRITRAGWAVPGMTGTGELSKLACSAATVALTNDDQKQTDRMDVKERRRRLLEMRNRLDEQVEESKRQFQEKTARFERMRDPPKKTAEA